ncbi:MAG: GNAT family N-acetyltransferase [Actinomycetes bacterium]
MATGNRTWTFSDDVDTFAEAAGPLLAGAPINHTIALSVIEDARNRAEPLDPPERYGWWTDGHGVVTGAMLHTPGHPSLLELAPDESIQPLVDVLAPLGVGGQGVNGPSHLALTFAAVAMARLGCRTRLVQAMRLFRLDVLRPPERRASGAVRRGHPSDQDLLAEWTEAFATEAHTTVANAADAVRRRLAHDGVRLWVEDGVPVSFAARTRSSAGVSRIGPVYTPSRFRRRGFGAAVTSAVAADILAEGSTPVLFTDAANPTSNALYQRLGFTAVDDRVWLTFEE